MKKVSKKKLKVFKDSVYAFIRRRYNPTLKEDSEWKTVYDLETHYGKATLTFHNVDQIGYNIFMRFEEPNKHTSTYTGKYNLHASDKLDIACKEAYSYLDVLGY